MADASRYAFYPRTHLSKQRRTHSVWGAQEDTGKYFSCWNCGFICNVERDQLDYGDHARAGIVPTTFTDADGSTLYYPKVTGGCPLCGCKNYKG